MMQKDFYLVQLSCFDAVDKWAGRCAKFTAIFGAVIQDIVAARFSQYLLCFIAGNSFCPAIPIGYSPLAVYEVHAIAQMIKQLFVKLIGMIFIA